MGCFKASFSIALHFILAADVKRAVGEREKSLRLASDEVTIDGFTCFFEGDGSCCRAGNGFIAVTFSVYSQSQLA